MCVKIVRTSKCKAPASSGPNILLCFWRYSMILQGELLHLLHSFLYWDAQSDLWTAKSLVQGCKGNAWGLGWPNSNGSKLLSNHWIWGEEFPSQYLTNLQNFLKWIRLIEGWTPPKPPSEAKGCLLTWRSHSPRPMFLLFFPLAAVETRSTLCSHRILYD